MNKRATLQSIPATNEDPRPVCCSQALQDDSYVFIPFGADEQMQFRNFRDDWYAKENSQFDALKEALGAYPVEVQNAVCHLFPVLYESINRDHISHLGKLPRNQYKYNPPWKQRTGKGHFILFNQIHLKG